jgi:hypothetical protein
LNENGKFIDFLPKEINFDEIESKLKEWKPQEIHLDLLANDFFRKVNYSAVFSDKQLDDFRKSISKNKLNVFFAPQMLYSELSRLFPIYFTHGEYSLLINKDKVSGMDDPFKKAILENFLIYREEKKLLPYWLSLPLAIRIFIGEDNKPYLCDELNEDLFNYSIIQAVSYQNGIVKKTDYEAIIKSGSAKNINLVCIHPNSTEQIDFISEAKPNLIVISRNLSLIANKYKLDTEFEISELYEKLKGNSLLLRMCGGKNYIKLTEDLTDRLGIQLPEFAESIWLENINKSLFGVYYNLNIDSIIKN